MNTNKAAYWIALGVLALGLNSEYRHGSFVTLHRAVDRADSVLCRIATRAEETLAVARVRARHEDFPADGLFAATDRAELARVQAELLREQARDRAALLRDRVRDQIRAQADVMRARAEIQRAEIDQMRSRTRSEFRFASVSDRGVTVICPKTRARILVNADPESDESSPNIEVDDNF